MAWKIEGNNIEFNEGDQESLIPFIPPIKNGEIDGQFYDKLDRLINSKPEANRLEFLEELKRISELSHSELKDEYAAGLKGFKDFLDVTPADDDFCHDLLLAINYSYRDKVEAIDLSERFDGFNKISPDVDSTKKPEVFQFHPVGRPVSDRSEFMVDSTNSVTPGKPSTAEKKILRLRALVAGLPPEFVIKEYQNKMHKTHRETDVFAQLDFDPHYDQSAEKQRLFIDLLLDSDSTVKTNLGPATVANPKIKSKTTARKSDRVIMLSDLFAIYKDAYEKLKVETKADQRNFAEIYQAFLTKLKADKAEPSRADRITASNLAQIGLILQQRDLDPLNDSQISDPATFAASKYTARDSLNETATSDYGNHGAEIRQAIAEFCVDPGPDVELKSSTRYGDAVTTDITSKSKSKKSDLKAKITFFQYNTKAKSDDGAKSYVFLPSAEAFSKKVGPAVTRDEMSKDLKLKNSPDVSCSHIFNNSGAFTDFHNRSQALHAADFTRRKSLEIANSEASKAADTKYVESKKIFAKGDVDHQVKLAQQIVAIKDVINKATILFEDDSVGGNDKKDLIALIATQSLIAKLAIKNQSLIAYTPQQFQLLSSSFSELITEETNIEQALRMAEAADLSFEIENGRLSNDNIISLVASINRPAKVTPVVAAEQPVERTSADSLAGTVPTADGLGASTLLPSSPEERGGAAAQPVVRTSADSLAGTVPTADGLDAPRPSVPYTDPQNFKFPEAITQDKKAEFQRHLANFSQDQSAQDKIDALAQFMVRNNISYDTQENPFAAELPEALNAAIVAARSSLSTETSAIPAPSTPYSPDFGAPGNPFASTAGFEDPVPEPAVLGDRVLTATATVKSDPTAQDLMANAGMAAARKSREQQSGGRPNAVTMLPGSDGKSLAANTRDQTPVTPTNISLNL